MKYGTKKIEVEVKTVETKGQTVWVVLKESAIERVWEIPVAFLFSNATARDYVAFRTDQEEKKRQHRKASFRVVEMWMPAMEMKDDEW